MPSGERSRLNYWMNAAVKSPGSNIHLLPQGNTSLVSGLFLASLGLVSFSCAGATVSTPHDETLRALFEWEPHSMAAEFGNYVAPYLRLRCEVTAIGEDEFVLRYSVKSRAREPRAVVARFRAVSDRPAAEQRVEGNEAVWAFDLGEKAERPGAGFYDFSELREFFLEGRHQEVRIRFEGATPQLAQRRLIAADGGTVVEAEVATAEFAQTIEPGGEATWSVRLRYRAQQPSTKPGAISGAPPLDWEQYCAGLPTVPILNDREQSAWELAWKVLYFNEVRRKGVRWILTGLNFPSMWVWDTSPFVVEAILAKDPYFAQHLITEQLRSMKTSGMQPLHAIEGLVHPEERPGELTQTPTIAASAARVFSATQDLDFARAVWAPLTKNYQWWQRERRPRHDVPLWGISDRRAPYFYGPESGLDNNPIFNEGPAYCLTINAAKAAFEGALSTLATALGYSSEAKEFAAAAEATTAHIRTHCWDSRDSFPYPLRYDGSKLRLKSADAFAALYFGVLDEKQTVALARTLEHEFLCDYGLSTVSRQEPCFDPANYSSGACWPFLNRFAYRGLRRAGEHDLADKILAGTLRSVTDFPGLFECFDGEAHTIARLKDGPISYPLMSFTAGAVIGMLLDRAEGRG